MISHMHGPICIKFSGFAGKSYPSNLGHEVGWFKSHDSWVITNIIRKEFIVKSCSLWRWTKSQVADLEVCWIAESHDSLGFKVCHSAAYLLNWEYVDLSFLDSINQRWGMCGELVGNEWVICWEMMIWGNIDGPPIYAHANLFPTNSQLIPINSISLQALPTRAYW